MVRKAQQRQADEPIPFDLGPEATSPRADRFAAFVAEYLQASAIHNKPSSLSCRTMLFETYLLPRFGALRLEEIGVREITHLQAELLGPAPAGSTGRASAGRAPRQRRQGKALSRKTVNNVCTVLRSTLRYAADVGLIEQAPRIPQLKSPLPEVYGMSPSETARLVKATAARWRPLILCAVRTGMRLGELRALQWDCVDLKGRVIRVRRNVWESKAGHQHIGTPKGGRPRRIPFGPVLAAALEYQRAAHPDAAFVFPGADGEVISKGSVKWPLRQACDAAGLPRVAGTGSATRSRCPSSRGASRSGASRCCSGTPRSP